VALADENASVVNRLGKTRLEDLGLEAALHEVLGLEGEDVVETHARVVQDTDAYQTADEGVTLVGRRAKGGRRSVCRSLTRGCPRKSLVRHSLPARLL